MEKIKLLIDTDMGGDVDDALALTAALRCPNVEVVGVSTCYLRPHWRAQVACDILRRCGAGDVPVAAGCGAPLAGAWDERHIHDTGAVPAQPHALSPLHGSDFILQKARQTAGLSILAIGPLTNLALALLKEPQALAGCRLYLMGGRLTSAQPEWNILCDPEAASLVLGAGLDVTLVPFEVTSQCQFSQAEVDAFTGTEYRDFLRGMMDAFTQKFGFLPMMHDPMALAMLAAPELFTFERRRIAVETQGRLTRGTLVDYGPDAAGNVRAAAADQPAFRRWITEKLMDG